MRDGRILDVSPSGSADPDLVRRAEEVGGFAMPGVVDAHVHAGLSDPGVLLACGVTGARDLGWPLDEVRGLAEDIRTGRRSGPHLTYAGPMLTALGGYPSAAAWAPPGTAREIAGAPEAAEVVVALAAAGAVVIKVALNSDVGPVLADEVLSALVAAARGGGLDVVAHCQGRGQVDRALAAGVRELAHAPWTERLSDTVIRGLAGTTRIVSTLDIHGWGEETEAAAIARENLSAFRRAGGHILYGTDLGNGDVPAGISVREMRALVACGLTGDDLLAVSTRTRLVPGAAADVAILADDPRSDVEAFGRILRVYRGGVPAD